MRNWRLGVRGRAPLESGSITGGKRLRGMRARETRDARAKKGGAMWAARHYRLMKLPALGEREKRAGVDGPLSPAGRVYRDTGPRGPGRLALCCRMNGPPKARACAPARGRMLGHIHYLLIRGPLRTAAAPRSFHYCRAGVSWARADSDRLFTCYATIVFSANPER